MVSISEATESSVWEVLKNIPDPEVPVLSIVDLGIVRNILISENEIEVTLTPTYSGCPAMKVIEDEIVSQLKETGISEVRIKTIFTPVWTTDWISEEAKEKLRAYGIAPPEKTSVDKGSLTGKPKNISCPRCNSTNVAMISQFGSTACKALYRCSDCREPFDYFKCH